jgi:hypothetical protein
MPILVAVVGVAILADLNAPAPVIIPKKERLTTLVGTELPRPV